jgi:hypothetical protein
MFRIFNSTFLLAVWIKCNVYLKSIIDRNRHIKPDIVDPNNVSGYGHSGFLTFQKNKK